MLSKKGYTLMELVTVMGIIVMISSAASFGYSSFGMTAELMSIENLLTMQLRSEKMRTLSGEAECSVISVFYKREYYSVLRSSAKNDNTCTREIFGRTFTQDKEVFIELLSDNNIDDLRVFASDSTNKEINTSIRTLGGKKYLNYKIDFSQSYAIKLSGGYNTEELDIMFYNSDIKDIDIGDPKMISVEEIEGTSFRKYKFYGNTLDIIIKSPNPAPISYLDNVRIQDIKIKMTKGYEEETEFNLYGANLFR